MYEKFCYTWMLFLLTIYIIVLAHPLFFYSVLAVLGIGNGKQMLHNRYIYIRS